MKWGGESERVGRGEGGVAYCFLSVGGEMGRGGGGRWGRSGGVAYWYRRGNGEGGGGGRSWGVAY